MMDDKARTLLLEYRRNVERQRCGKPNCGGCLWVDEKLAEIDAVLAPHPSTHDASGVPDPIATHLHKLWTQYAGTTGYVKSDWLALQSSIAVLAAQAPQPHEPEVLAIARGMKRTVKLARAFSGQIEAGLVEERAAQLEVAASSAPAVPPLTPMNCPDCKACSDGERDWMEYCEKHQPYPVAAPAVPRQESDIESLRAYGETEATSALKGKDREMYQFWQGWNAALDRLAPVTSHETPPAARPATSEGVKASATRMMAKHRPSLERLVDAPPAAALEPSMSQIILKHKNYWMDRALVAEAKLASLLDTADKK